MWVLGIYQGLELGLLELETSYYLMSWLILECMSAKSVAEGLCLSSWTSTRLRISLTGRGSSRIEAGGCPSASSFGTRRASWGSFAVPADQARMSVKRTKANNLFTPQVISWHCDQCFLNNGHFRRTKDSLATAMYLCSGHRLNVYDCDPLTT